VLNVLSCMLMLLLLLLLLLLLCIIIIIMCRIVSLRVHINFKWSHQNTIHITIQMALLHDVVYVNVKLIHYKVDYIVSNVALFCVIHVMMKMYVVFDVSHCARSYSQSVCACVCVCVCVYMCCVCVNLSISKSITLCEMWCHSMSFMS